MMEEDSSLSSESSSESDYSENEEKQAEQRRKRKMTTQRYSRQSIEKLIEDKSSLPVTCGDKEGSLFIEKFNNREKCILSEDQWFKPSEFEKFGGKEKSKKWKTTILCCGVPLQNLIEDKFISCPDFKKSRIQHDEISQSESRERSPVPGRLRKTKRNSSESSRDSGMLRRTKARKRLVSSSSESEERDSVHYENNSDDDDDEMNITMFQGPTLPVTCGSVTGILHKKRFAKGYCGKCIRTEDLWLTPEDFLRLGKPDGIWKKDIVVHETTLGKLILRRVLEPDAVSCDCDVCQELNQTNDDDCYVCASEEEVVCCDECPRAFHPHCHLPAAVDIDSGSQWTCTFCMMRKMEESNQRTRQEVLNSPLFQYKLHCQYLLLYLLHEWTAEPCTKVLDSKADDIKLNLQNDNYQTVDEFVTDIEHIFQHHTSEGNNDFSRMEHLFKEEFKTIFKLI
ncbi:nuclear body protein SP140-like protein isoform X2 [Misgurnus anguillicaudatus]|uniref:nuclear body protein SP140-like protein isoform X2 n=1 Tax=Misgurnus anguillicaudatus TaxID=75329 RepID=UPI003CCF7B40